MPESVILNELVKWDEEIEDCMSPDYGFNWKRPLTRSMAKPAGGQPTSKETANTGHSFQFGWLNRSMKCIQRLKYFYEQYEDGFFTIIDHDWGDDGRHCVGRFTGEWNSVEVGNDRYNVQGLTFEEVPGAPMLEYPTNWDKDAVRRGAFNDYGTLKLSLNGTWIQVALNSGDPINQQVVRSLGSAGDFATYEYRGYGFRLWMANGPAYGQVLVSVDGTLVATLDLYTAQDLGLQLVLEMPKISLDLHRVKVQVSGNQNPASTSPAVIWGYMEIMR